MTDLDRIEVIPRAKRVDERGWLLKTLTGAEAHLPSGVGEVYVVYARPGVVRGNHYHPATGEWFTLLSGAARLSLQDPVTGQRRELTLREDEPQTVYVPPGIAHAFCTPDGSEDPMLLLAYADRAYDPADVVPLEVI